MNIEGTLWGTHSFCECGWKGAAGECDPDPDGELLCPLCAKPVSCDVPQPQVPNPPTAIAVLDNQIRIELYVAMSDEAKYIAQMLQDKVRNAPHN